MVSRIGLDAGLSFVVWGWLAGVTLLLARFGGGCWRVHRVRAAAVADGVSSWQAATERLAARLRLTVAFRVVESGLVDTPGVIGWVRPVILLPVAVLTNLSPIQIEAILAHELAHIRRRDYAVNLLQTVVEALLFYHPGVWWVSARVREEREHCCDDVAVEVCGEPRAYAAALAELAAWQTGEPAHAVGAADGSLVVRVRRLLRVQEDDRSRPVSGVVLALGMLLAAGVAMQSSSPLVAGEATGTGASTATLPVPLQAESPELPQEPQPAPLRAVPQVQAASAVAQPRAAEWRVHRTDHFEIYYQPDLALYAERAGQEAERAHEHVSSDLKHSLAFAVPVVLFPTANVFDQSAPAGLGPTHAASLADPSRDRILFAVDQPAHHWYGRLTHELAHIFLFDILPGNTAPRWFSEGLAEYERSAWDPADLAALRDAVRANDVPKMSALDGDHGSRDARLVQALGHAVFDFIESRWGKAGLRQLIFAVRQTARGGGDPYAQALQIARSQFDLDFERYLTDRFAGAAGQPPAGALDRSANLSIEGEVVAINARAPAGLACIELWTLTDGSLRRRWAVECGGGTEQEALRALRPGDRLIVTGAPRSTVGHAANRPAEPGAAVRRVHVARPLRVSGFKTTGGVRSFDEAQDRLERSRKAALAGPWRF